MTVTLKLSQLGRREIEGGDKDTGLGGKVGVGRERGAVCVRARACKCAVSPLLSPAARYHVHFDAGFISVQSTSRPS